MSTRSTIVLTDNCHLFHDGFDMNHVYLEMEESSIGTITLRIPALEWAELRQPEIRQSAHVGLDQHERRSLLRAGVERRIAKWREGGSDPNGTDALMGVALYGLVEQPVEEQVESAMQKLGLIES